jgi:cell pole-organizing protein PopZ
LRGRNGQRPEAEPELDSEADDDVLELSDPVSDEDRLISEGSAAASRQSLAVLAAMRQQNEAPASVASMGEGPLEAVIRDMLRPMLKEWLDERLPEIVEEMVAREIARITGKSF